MAITHDKWKQILGSSNLGRARKYDSDMVIDAAFDEDIQYQVGYFYDYSHDIGEERFKMYDLHPWNDLNKIPIDIKFIRHSQQTYNKDPITFWLQFRPSQDKSIISYYDDVLGANKYKGIWPVGMYVDVMAEDGKYNKWLVVNTANYWQDQFPTWELLKCDYLLQWVHKGKKCECPGVLQSQNSQIVRFTLETVYRKFLNCWEDSFNRVNQHRSRINPKRSTSKVRQAPENGNHLSRNDMVLICSKLIGDYEKIYLNIAVNRQDSGLQTVL